MSEGRRLESLRRLELGRGNVDNDLDQLAEVIRRSLDADAAVFTAVDAMHAWPAGRSGWLEAVVLPRSRSLADLAISSGETVWVRDVPADGRLTDHPWTAADPALHAVAATALWSPDAQPIGALEVAWCEGSSVPADAEGFVQHAAGQFARRLELRAEVAEYRRFVNLAPDAFVVLDLEGVIERCNPAFATLLGERHTSALRGRGFLELVTPEHRERATAELAGVLVARRWVGTVDLTLERADGSRLPVEINVGHLRGPRRNLQLVVRDQTERLRAEADRARLSEQLAEAHRFETVGQLAGGLAHDLNNLLAVLVANLSLAEETLAGIRDDVEGGVAALTDDLGHLRAASDRVDRLTRKLLQFAARSEGTVGPVDLADVAASLQDLLERSLGAECTLTVEVEDEVPDVEVDRGELEQAVTNLLLNGRDAMPDGGRLTLRIRSGDDAGPGASCGSGAGAGTEPSFAVIEVEDEGIGMTDAVLARAFEPLFSTKGIDRGTGLGLSSVRAFVQRVGGSVHVDTEPGEGICVRLVLPALTASVPDEVPAVAPGEGAPLVLLVDPAERSRRVIATMFERTGHRVEEVADAASARERLQGDGLALLACELVLPDGVGPEVVAAARARQPGLPVLLLSSTADVRGDIDGVPILVKPFSSERLAEKVALARAIVGVPDPA